MESRATAADIIRRSRWYIGVRWFYLLGIGIPSISTLFVLYGYTQQVYEDFLLLFDVLVVNAAFLLLTYIHFKHTLTNRLIAAVQIAFDIGLMSVAYYVNRGSETPLAMWYAIPIFMTAAFFGRRAIYLTGVTVMVLYAVLSLLDFTGRLRVLHIAAPQLHTDPRLFFPSLIVVLAITLAITIITDLVGRLIREREQFMYEVQALRTQHAETEAILRTMGSAMVAIDRQGVITKANDSFETLTGWKRDEIVGRDLDDVLPILDMHGQRVPAAHRPMLQYITDNQLDEVPQQRHMDGFSYVRRDGTTFPFVGNVAPIVSNKKIIGFTTVFEDMTESKKLDQLKDNFIALISHQLKTPLAEINGFAYNMLGGIAGALSKRQTDYMLQIQEQAARSGKLIADLLEIVLAGKGSLAVQNEPTDMTAVVAEVVKLRGERASNKGVKLETRLPAENIFVRGDTHKLVQALGNLADNAIRATKKGSVLLSVVPAADIVEVYVSDKGGGMDRATLETIFQSTDHMGPLAHAPTAEGGTGLGVYLAKQLISLMGGSIHVVSSTGRGTTICVTLKRVKP